MALGSLHGIKDLSLVLLSSLSLLLSFPSFDLGFLAWLGLVPLLLLINGKSMWYGFFSCSLCGIVFLLGIFKWILEVPGYTLLHHAILALYLGSYFGMFGLAFSFISRRRGMPTALFAAPFLWVSFEYIRSNLSFLALPWGLLAHSQYQNPLIIQIASLTGAYGITFLIVLVNSGIAAMAYALLGRLKKDKWEGLGGAKLVVVTASVFLVFSLLYGNLKTSKHIKGKEIKISVVQGNIDQKKKWDRKYAKFIMKTYADLTIEASRDEPAMIVWPETATPRAINMDAKLSREVRGIANSAGTYLLLGSSQPQKFKVGDSKNIKYFNSAFLIPPEAKKTKNQRYDKIRLFPFGEYLPYKETIPWSSINVPEVSGYVTGKEFTVFEHPEFRFGVTICWENLFPDLVRQFVKAGAQLMINITNEAWFGKTAAPDQFVSMSVFRAVENRLFVIRCTNTGISCFIDPCGRIVNRLKDKHGKEIFIRGVLTAPVIPIESGTFYTRYGDWLAWLSLGCSVGFLFVVFFKGKRNNLKDSDRISLNKLNREYPVNSVKIVSLRKDVNCHKKAGLEF